MTPSLADLLPYLLAIVAMALLLVYVMVQWSRVAVSLPTLRLPKKGAPERRPAVRWSLAYATAWGALIAAYLALFNQLPSGDTFRNVALLVLVVSAWLAVNFILVVFIRALARTQGVEVSRRPAPSRAPAVEPEPAETPLRPAPPPIRTRVLNALLLVRNVLLVLLVIAIGEALPPLQRLNTWTQAHQQTLLAVTISLTALGFILLMGMAIHLVLTRGKPMSRREVDGLAARRLTAQPALLRRSAYRSRGIAVGAQAEDSATFSEVKAAWRARAWQVSPRWRRLFAGLIGTALLATGIFGLFVVVGPPGIKLLCGGTLLYAWVRSVSAFARA